MSNKLRIQYTRSAIGYQLRQKLTIKALGLHHLGDVREHDDTPAVRGMLHKVAHLVRVEEVKP
jgi:large subunit ribosomal protein L30